MQPTASFDTGGDGRPATRPAASGWRHCARYLCTWAVATAQSKAAGESNHRCMCRQNVHRAGRLMWIGAHGEWGCQDASLQITLSSEKICWDGLILCSSRAHAVVL
jgi:hypothetical protein